MKELLLFFQLIIDIITVKVFIIAPLNYCTPLFLSSISSLQNCIIN